MKLLSIFSLLLLSGCSLFQEKVVVKQTYIFFPEELMKACEKPEFKGKIMEDLVRGYITLSEAFDICAGQIEAQQQLKKKLLEEQNGQTKEAK